MRLARLSQEFLAPAEFGVRSGRRAGVGAPRNTGCMTPGLLSGKISSADNDAAGKAQRIQLSKQDLQSRRRLASVFAETLPALRARAAEAPSTEEAATASRGLRRGDSS